MSDTPETDHLENGLGKAAEMSHPTLWAFARTLERERNDLREIFPMILVSLKSGACAATCSVDFLRKIPKEVRLVRERLERERDEARGQRDKAIAMLWRLNVAATDCYNAAFDYSNPPREQDVLPIINEVDEFLTTSCEKKPSNP